MYFGGRHNGDTLLWTNIQSPSAHVLKEPHPVWAPRCSVGRRSATGDHGCPGAVGGEMNHPTKSASQSAVSAESVGSAAALRVGLRAMTVGVTTRPALPATRNGGRNQTPWAGPASKSLQACRPSASAAASPTPGMARRAGR
jgi:hypothetical protein